MSSLSDISTISEGSYRLFEERVDNGSKVIKVIAAIIALVLMICGPIGAASIITDNNYLSLPFGALFPVTVIGCGLDLAAILGLIIYFVTKR